jgi:enoyl-CoA hydratase/carnithine racemase
VTGLELRREGGVLWLTLARPHQLNALTDQLSDALATELEQATTYDDVRVVVIAGAGRAFCAGADISAGDGPARLDGRALDRVNRIVRAVTRLDKPVVAAVRGVAAGAGCSLALACDLTVASESASFLLAFARIGLMPDGGSTASVAASIGRARAMRMAVLAEPLTAREAYDAGLVSHLVDDDAFDSVVTELADRLVAGPPLALAATKRAVNAATYAGFDDALERERTGQTVLLRTADAAEGMRAFAERRTPVFEGE